MTVAGRSRAKSVLALAAELDALGIMRGQWWKQGYLHETEMAGKAVWCFEMHQNAGCPRKAVYADSLKLLAGRLWLQLKMPYLKEIH